MKMYESTEKVKNLKELVSRLRRTCDFFITVYLFFYYYLTSFFEK